MELYQILEATLEWFAQFHGAYNRHYVATRGF